MARRSEPEPSAGSADADRLTKRMSLTEPEFRAGVAALVPGAEVGAAWQGGLPVRLLIGGGSVTLGYEPQPALRLGGLLELPQAEVSLTFEALGPAERAEFERRFWIVFQRGGG